MRTGESRWIDRDCDSFIDGDLWERKGRRANLGVQVQQGTTSPAYEKWFHSDDTQAKLKSGEYRIAEKSHNVNHL